MYYVILNSSDRETPEVLVVESNDSNLSKLAFDLYGLRPAFTTEAKPHQVEEEGRIISLVEMVAEKTHDRWVQWRLLGEFPMERLPKGFLVAVLHELTKLKAIDKPAGNGDQTLRQYMEEKIQESK